MPWTCKPCDVEVSSDTGSCPSCSAVKTSWTIVDNQTRVLRIGTAVFGLQKGDGTQSLPEGDPGNNAVTLSKAPAIRAIHKSTVRALSEKGHVPASGDLLFVRMLHREATDLEVSMELVFHADAARDESRFPKPPAPNPRPEVVYVRLLFVYGDGEVSDDFPGIHVVDVTEEGDPGHAEKVAFSALGLRAKTLPVEAVAGVTNAAASVATHLEIRVENDGEPVTGVPLTITADGEVLPPEITDSLGTVRVEGLAPGAVCSVSCDTTGVTLTPGNSYSPAPFEGRPVIEPLTGPAEDMADVIQRVRRIELANPGWSGEMVLEALLDMGGVFRANFRAMYGGRPKPELLKAKETPVDDFCTPPPDVNYLVAHSVAQGPFDNVTLESIANDAGTDVATLANFNWGKPGKGLANLCLGALVGCTSTDSAGTYLLTNDTPGSVYLPSPWVQDGLTPQEAPVVIEVKSHALGIKAGLLTQDEIDALGFSVAHGSAENGRPESGNPMDRGSGHPVSPSHMMIGIYISRHRLRNHNLLVPFIRLAAEEKGLEKQVTRRYKWAERVLGWWGIRDDAEAFLRWVAQEGAEAVLDDPKMVRVDNLYAASLSGDLGQSAVQNHQDGTSTYVGDPACEASHAELVGDIDCIILGDNLASWLASDFNGRGLTTGLRLSEVLARYYSTDPTQQLPCHAGIRFRTFQQAYMHEEAAAHLRKEITSFSTLWTLVQMKDSFSEHWKGEVLDKKLIGEVLKHAIDLYYEANKAAYAAFVEWLDARVAAESSQSA